MLCQVKLPYATFGECEQLKAQLENLEKKCGKIEARRIANLNDWEEIKIPNLDDYFVFSLDDYHKLVPIEIVSRIAKVPGHYYVYEDGDTDPFLTWEKSGSCFKLGEWE